MGDQRNHQFGAVLLHRIAAKQPAKYRNTGKPGNAGEGLAVGLLNNAANQVDLPVLHPDIGGQFVLPDFRLVNAAQVDRGIHLRNIQIEVHRHFAVIHHNRQNVQIHTDIEIGKLRIHQRTHADRRRTGLKAAAGGRNLGTNFQLGLHVTYGANLRSLQNAGAGIAEDGLKRRPGQ